MRKNYSLENFKFIDFFFCDNYLEIQRFKVGEFGIMTIPAYRYEIN